MDFCSIERWNRVDQHKEVLLTLPSASCRYVTSVLKVRRTESRWLWSFSLADKK